MEMNKNSLLLIITSALLLSGIAFKSTEIQETPSLKVHQAFLLWMKTHNKQYKSPEEFNHRLSLFSKIYSRVNSLKGKRDFEIGLNKFSDLSTEEFKAKYTGYKRRTGERKFLGREELMGESVPKEVDWRKSGMVAPIKNQGECGSCWAFAVTSSLEFLYAKSSKRVTRLSEQQLLDCSSKYGNYGCEGGYTQTTFEYVINEGIMEEREYPYIGRESVCKGRKENGVLKISNYIDVRPRNGRELELAVSKGVVTVAVDATRMMSYKSGIMSWSYCRYRRLDHAVSVVGYGRDESLRKDYWIVRNSWGTDWGMEGYILLEKDTSKRGVGACGIRLDASYPIL